MKLLLTSAGLTNKTIKKALFDLVGKKPKDIKVAFIPTAANLDSEDKSWFINNLNQIRNQKFKMVDIVDISTLPRRIWQPRLEAVDLLIFSGGNSSHLMRWVRESGLEKLLPKLLKTRVYVGISAGSIITSPTLALSSKDKRIYYKKTFGHEINKGLGFINFYIRPHLNSPYFPHASEKVLKRVVKKVPTTLYGIDDNMAIKFIDGKIEVVGEGKLVVFNK